MIVMLILQQFLEQLFCDKDKVNLKWQIKRTVLNVDGEAAVEWHHSFSGGTLILVERK